MTNYEKLFGTPEKTAEHFALRCFGSDGSMCYYCPVDGCDTALRKMGSYPSLHNTILEWLESEVRDD